MAPVLPKWLEIQSKGTMVLSFLAGTAFTVGHHFFYKHLAGRTPSNSQYDIVSMTTLTGQQINLAVGAIIVFFVRFLFSMAIGRAHEQTAWRAIRNPNQHTKVATIDELLSSTSNGLSVFRPSLWKQSVLSMCLTVFSWLLTIAFFLPASTLTVLSLVNQNNFMINVPRIDFLSMNFANVVSVVSTSPDYRYDGPQFAVQAAVFGSIAGSEILQVTAPAPNSSWALEFDGPALYCNTVDGDLYTKIIDNIRAAENYAQNQSAYGYISWTSSSSPDDPLPFIGDDYVLNSPDLGLGPTSNSNDTNQSPGPLSLYVAALPNMLLTFSLGTTETIAPELENATIVECLLKNASYSANFTIVDSVQTVEVERHEVHNNVSYLEGVAGAIFLNATYPNYTVIPDQFNTSMVSNFAYQAVMNTFNSILLGTISIQKLDAQVELVNTSMAMTPLINTVELGFLFNLKTPSVSSLNLQDLPISSWNGLSVIQETNFTATMADVLETMFTNATVSLMSSRSLNPNYTSPYAPGLVNVTTTPYRNTYVYSPAVLWISYGFAIVFTILSIVSGIIAAFAQDASYTTKFSTILRVSQNAQLSAPILPKDTGGEDPTPEDVEQIGVLFPPTRHMYEAVSPGQSDVDSMKEPGQM